MAEGGEPNDSKVPKYVCETLIFKHPNEMFDTKGLKENPVPEKHMVQYYEELIDEQPHGRFIEVINKALTDKMSYTFDISSNVYVKMSYTFDKGVFSGDFMQHLTITNYSALLGQMLGPAFDQRVIFYRCDAGKINGFALHIDWNFENGFQRPGAIVGIGRHKDDDLIVRYKREKEEIIQFVKKDGMGQNTLSVRDNEGNAVVELIDQLGKVLKTETWIPDTD